MIQRGSCGYDASDRRRRSPDPKLVGSARHNSPRPTPSRRGPLYEWDTWPVRAHEPVNPFGLALLSALRGCRRCRAPDADDGSHVEGAPVSRSALVGPSTRLPASRSACFTQGGNRLCGRLELRSSSGVRRTHLRPWRRNSRISVSDGHRHLKNQLQRCPPKRVISLLDP